MIAALIARFGGNAVLLVFQSMWISIMPEVEAAIRNSTISGVKSTWTKLVKRVLDGLREPPYLDYPKCFLRHDGDRLAWMSTARPTQKSPPSDGGGESQRRNRLLVPPPPPEEDEEEEAQVTEQAVNSPHADQPPLVVHWSSVHISEKSNL